LKKNQGLGAIWQMNTCRIWPMPSRTDCSAAHCSGLDGAGHSRIVCCWGGGLVTSADGPRLVVPVRTINAGPNSRYFGCRRGATWLNVINHQVMGIGGVVVPGTLRDSLFILDAIHNRDGGPRPEMVVTDATSYSDVVFGLFAICGHQVSPRVADLADTRLGRVRTRRSDSEADS
jgi:TnpA family transposase